MPRTKNTYLVANSVVLHQEPIAVDDVGIHVPDMTPVFQSLDNKEGRHGIAHQAKASSRILAPQRKSGETTPGLNHVPIPA